MFPVQTVMTSLASPPGYWWGLTSWWVWWAPGAAQLPQLPAASSVLGSSLKIWAVFVTLWHPCSIHFWTVTCLHSDLEGNWAQLGVRWPLLPTSQLQKWTFSLGHCHSELPTPLNRVATSCSSFYYHHKTTIVNNVNGKVLLLIKVFFSD